jgi:hypothetical protein
VTEDDINNCVQTFCEEQGNVGDIATGIAMHEENRLNNYLSKRAVSTFSYVPKSCPEGHWCWLLENINGISSAPVLKFKAQRLNELKQEYDFDGA